MSSGSIHSAGKKFDDVERVTVRIPRHQADALEQVTDADLYANRSQAIRVGIDKLLQ